MSCRKVKYCFLLFFSGSTVLSFSQSISRSVISSSGNFASNASSALYCNAGEVIVNPFISTSNLLTQGFEQPLNPILTSITNSTTCFTEITLYPIPATGTINIKTDVPCQFLIIEIIDVQGRILILSSNPVSSADKIFSVEISTLKSGIYFIKFIDKNTNQTIDIGKFSKI